MDENISAPPQVPVQPVPSQPQPAASAPVTPPQPSVPIEPIAPQIPKPKSKFLIILLVVLVLVALGLVGVFVYGKYISKSSTSPTIQPSPISSSTPTPTPDPTVDWITFTKPSYSVKAPQQLRLAKEGNGDYKDFLMLSVPNLSGKTPEKGIDITFAYVFGNGIVKCATNKDCYDYYNSTVKGSESAGSKTITTPISAIISGQNINGFRQLDSSSENFNLTKIWIIYPISHNGNLFQINIDVFGKSESEIDQYLTELSIDQILSTFKFTQ